MTKAEKDKIMEEIHKCEWPAEGGPDIGVCDIERILDKLVPSPANKTGSENIPSHEEIMSLWWQTGLQTWTRVKKYDYSPCSDRCYQMSNGRYWSRYQFKGLKSAIIPPEEK